MVRWSRGYGLAMLALALAAWAGPEARGDGKGGGSAWVKDYEEARKQARESGKWLFIDFYTDT
ncbi:MAG: hypothetical protein HZA54_19165 [Planctomycetes bacterium]|nr:hypothetical protein [Planctomycetota bacterium]